ncbi:putative phosphopantothenoylcysteine decarboxylase [Vanrija pseudolonga]|uniref:Phosphopantothenoylcysteine decarboxylase n=1 Tax=Vanrija pseudolonga TaxID=143232 RepID=A0AAF0Y4N5_9TREE|nr:putative phosphopantothenoylcysteine decarboxylase [Vanrija pseudolonga]
MDYTPPLSDGGYGTPMPGQAVHVPPIKAKPPFVAAQHRPTADDGLFHVLLVSSGARASSQVPYIVGALSKDPQIALQIVATERSLRYYDQQAVDAAVRHTWNLAPEASTEFGVRIWTDADDSAGASSTDPILHVELHKWADIVVVAPCSADMLAQMVQGLSGNLALEITRSLDTQTPLVICPSLSTPMFRNRFTKQHLTAATEDLGGVVLGPQARGKLDCGDEGEGVMTDWRDIVIAIQDFSSMYRIRMTQKEAEEAERNPAPAATAFERLQADFDVDTVFHKPGVTKSANPEANGVSLNWADAGFPAKDIMQQMFHQPGLPSTREPGSRLTGARLSSISDVLREQIGKPPRPRDESDTLDWPKITPFHGSTLPPVAKPTPTNPPLDEPGSDKVEGLKEFFHDRGLKTPRQGTFVRGPESEPMSMEPLRLGPMEHWKAMGQGSYWQTRWWAG